MTRLFAISAVLVSLLIAGCGGDDDNDDSASGSQQSASSEAAMKEKEKAKEEAAMKAKEKKAKAEAAIKAKEKKAAAGGGAVTIETAGSEFGAVLFDGSQRAIYYFDKETSSKSQCYGACAEAWPPVLTQGAAKAGQGAQAGLLGTTKRTDGTTQVTYDGHPLYYYVDDPPGQVLCHNVEEFGGLWLAVQPSGEAVS